MIYFSHPSVQAAMAAALKHKVPRPAWTYRGARRRADGENARAKDIRDQRRRLGMTRRAFDKWRHEQAQLFASEAA